MHRLALALVLLAAPAAAQDAPASADTPEGAVARLFDGMRARDSSVVASVLHPDLRLMTVMQAPDGAVRLGESPRAGFLEAVAGAPVVLDERIADLEVRTDGALATAWMTYRFYAGEQFSHCGVNAIQLARLDGRWQMIHVMDTRRRECDE